VPLGNVATHHYVEVEIEDFDLDRLSEALNLLIARHAMLRAIVQPMYNSESLRACLLNKVASTDLRKSAGCRSDACLADARRELSHRIHSPRNGRCSIHCARIASTTGATAAPQHGPVDADARSFQILHRECWHSPRSGSHGLPPLSISFRD